MNRGVKGVAWGLAATAAAGFAYAAGVEVNDFQVRRVFLPLLPEGSPELRVLHLSDSHLLPRQKQKRDFLRGLNGLAPDLVVSTGDLVSSEDAIAALAESLGPLLEVPGVFVFGSNDYHIPRFQNPLRYLWGTTSERKEHAHREMPTEHLRHTLESGAWRDVTDRRILLELKGVPLEIRGTGDAHKNRDDYEKVAGAPAEGTLSLGVTHAPYLRLLDAMTLDGVDLILAGHTHGGQVCLPAVGALVTNCDLPTSRAKGVFRYNSGRHFSQVSVSGGVGTSPFAPYRFACRPEVTLLTLTDRTSPHETGM